MIWVKGIFQSHEKSPGEKASWTTRCHVFPRFLFLFYLWASSPSGIQSCQHGSDRHCQRSREGLWCIRDYDLNHAFVKTNSDHKSNTDLCTANPSDDPSMTPPAFLKSAMQVMHLNQELMLSIPHGCTLRDKNSASRWIRDLTSHISMTSKPMSLTSSSNWAVISSSVPLGNSKTVALDPTNSMTRQS